jgi:glycosyltransferase involved in cell wall biosynthesis
MEYGLPVISNNVGAINEILTGYLSKFITSNSEKYLSKLWDLIEDKSIRLRNGAESRKIASNFYWEKILPKWLDLYN